MHVLYIPYRYNVHEDANSWNMNLPWIVPVLRLSLAFGLESAHVPGFLLYRCIARHQKVDQACLRLNLGAYPRAHHSMRSQRGPNRLLLVD